MNKKKSALKWFILIVIFILIIIGLYFYIFCSKKEKQQLNTKEIPFVHDTISQIINAIENYEKEKVSKTEASVQEENHLDNDNQPPINNEESKNNSQQIITNDQSTTNNQQVTTNNQSTTNNQQVTTNNQQATNSNHQITNNNQPVEVYTIDNDIPMDSSLRKDTKTLEECLSKGNEIKSRYEDTECINGCRVICHNIYGKHTGQIIGYQLTIRIQDGVGTELRY